MAETKKLNEKIEKDKESIPPDGGWGWMIVIAGGLTNLCIMPISQQFGLLFRDKFSQLEFTSTQTATIINVYSAMTACVGVTNGPMFRKYSFRQASLAAALVIFISIFATAFCNSFIAFLIFFSVAHGIGYGIISSANNFALHTYWKNRRRLATSLLWTLTGLGPIIWPYVITTLCAYYGEAGSIFILCGVALHSVACALLLHPVEWHAKTRDSTEESKNLLPSSNDKNLENIKEKNSFDVVTTIKNLSAFSSQYLFNEDDPITPGYEITHPGVPMMTRANDGYFSQSRQSKTKLSSREESSKPSRLNSKKPSITGSDSDKSSTLCINEFTKSSLSNLEAATLESNFKQTLTTSISVHRQIIESEIVCFSKLTDSQISKDEKIVSVDSIDLENLKSNKVETSNPGYKGVDEQSDKDSESIVSQKNTEDVDRKSISDSSQKQDTDGRKSTGESSHSSQYYRNKVRRTSNNFNYEKEVLRQASLKLEQFLKEEEKNVVDKDELLLNSIVKEDIFDEKEETIEYYEEDKKELNFSQKIIIFFELDLLKDLSFVNLMLGMTLTGFSELNFSLLTPFILGDYGMSKSDVAFFLTVLAGVDICIRFCVPLVASKIKWNNNSFFLFGVIIITLGRVILAHFYEYPTMVLLVAIIIGFGKGFRTVFITLLIPSYVPLNKLPGATGLQLITSSFVCFLLGSGIGWMRDNTSTAVLLYSLNIFTWLTALSWGIEKHISLKQLQQKKKMPNVI